MEKKMSLSLSEGKTSDVYFAKDIKDLSTGLSSYGDNVFWVFDTNSARLFSSLPEKRIVIDSGETNKNLKSLEKIIERALSFGSARDTRFLAFGGGVICDMTALASSLYMRGTRLTLVPTTLLCMVDATLGGKTAIDYLGAKNLVGTFYPAEDIVISIDTLRTLPDKEFKSGLGEVIKHAFLTEDPSLLSFLHENREKILKRDKETLNIMVEDSLLVKKKFIEADPRETKGIRSFLNLGHTFAHALESMAGYRISHGEAVAWGLLRAIEASYITNLCNKDLYDLAYAILKEYGYDVDYRIGRGDWIAYFEALKKDKKKSNGSVKFVLLESLGKPCLLPLEEKYIRAVTLESAKIRF